MEISLFWYYPGWVHEQVVSQEQDEFKLALLFIADWLLHTNKQQAVSGR